MENFIVSARKYRPQTFDTVVGQAHITSTLKNAIENNHVAQAYLFCGPRGVGKTTCARILAKTINCFHPTKNIEACDKCESCLSFNEGRSLNIYELDAASNNSVEDIRNLINQVSFAPQIGIRKVYIIDEVHMLSQAAFNAFLKTLEEPPRHAIFILATTEKHKIIPTILSRCQIFDFNRIRIEDTVTHLASIAKKEKIKVEEDALHIIAQKADGAMRDALSIYDQMVSVAGDNITYKAVIDNLSILDYDYYFKIIDAVLEKNTASALLLFNEILNSGFDGHNFINGLAEHIRNLLVCRDEATLQLMEVSGNIRERYKIQTKKTEFFFLLSALEILSKADYQYKGSKNQRLLVEVTLLQLCSIQPPSATGGEKKNDILAKPVVEVPAVPAKSKSEPASATHVVVSMPEEKKPVSVSPPKEKIIPVAKEKSISKGNVLSIASITRGNQEKGSIKKDKPGIKYSMDNAMPTMDMESLWLVFAESVKKKNKHNLYATLTAEKPVMNTKGEIFFQVLNHVQEDEINSLKTDLLSYLRGELKNPSVTLKVVVNKTEVVRKPYTGEEKFQRLAEKNPILNKLRQQFNLEIDY